LTGCQVDIRNHKGGQGQAGKMVFRLGI